MSYGMRFSSSERAAWKASALQSLMDHVEVFKDSILVCSRRRVRAAQAQTKTNMNVTTIWCGALVFEEMAEWKGRMLYAYMMPPQPIYRHKRWFGCTHYTHPAVLERYFPAQRLITSVSATSHCISSRYIMLPLFPGVAAPMKTCPGPDPVLAGVGCEES